MKVNQIGLFLEVLPKEKGGFVLVASEMTGTIVRLHTFDDYSNLLSTNRIFEYTYDVRPVGHGSNKTYSILTGRPKEIGEVSGTSICVKVVHQLYDWYKKNNLYCLLSQVQKSTDHMVRAAHAYLSSPKRHHHCDEKEVWDRIDLVKADIESMYQKHGTGRGTEFLPTYNGKYDTDEWDARISVNSDKTFMDTMEQVTREYRTKARYMTVSGDLLESQLSRIAGLGTGETSSHYPSTKNVAFVDSIFAQVCLRERHIAEFYVYFAIVTYMKRSRRYPSAKASDVLKFLRIFLKESHLKMAGKGILMHLVRIGMLEIEGDPRRSPDIPPGAAVRVLKQASYVRKWEKAWNSKNRRALRPKRIWRTADRPVDPLYPMGHNMEPLQWDAQFALDSVHRPYFDVHFPKTAKMDTGFIHILNKSAADQRAFLYELVVSSWAYPISRTRIAMNTLILPSTQRHYERKSKFMSKRFNHIEITKDMMERMSLSARQAIANSVRTGGKFKQSRSGKIYRQEGNTYISNRVEWKDSKRCSRLLLSPKLIKLWNAARPVFTKSVTLGGMPTISKAHFMPINEEICSGQSLSKTYISKKSQIHKGRYFGLSKDGVIVPSTNPDNWTWFEPLLAYDNRNGDLFAPLTPSLPQKFGQQWGHDPEVYGSREAGVSQGHYGVCKKLKTKHYAPSVFSGFGLAPIVNI